MNCRYCEELCIRKGKKEYSFVRNQCFLIILVVEQRPNGTSSWSTMINIASANGTHVRNFTPTQPSVRVKYLSGNAFSLADMSLESVDVDTSYALIARGRYRYGYQGSERDDEVKSKGNSYTTFFRQLDPRLGRWFSVDPAIQPWQSPYCSMDNNPIMCNDELGDKIKIREKGRDKREFKRMIRVARSQDQNFDAWYKTKRDEDNMNYFSFSDLPVGDAKHPTNFTAPRYRSSNQKDGWVKNPGEIITIDAGGTENYGTSCGDNSGHYYFARLERVISKNDNQRVETPVHDVPYFAGKYYNYDNGTYEAEIKLKETSFRFLSGYINPYEPGVQRVNFNIRDASGTPIVNFTTTDINTQGGIGTIYTPPSGTFTSSSRHIFITVTPLINSTFPYSNWSLRTQTTTSKTTSRWPLDILRPLKNIQLNNL